MTQTLVINLFKISTTRKMERKIIYKYYKVVHSLASRSWVEANSD